VSPPLFRPLPIVFLFVLIPRFVVHTLRLLNIDRDGNDERHADRDGESCRPVEAGAILGNAGEEVGDGTTDGEEDQRSSDPGDAVVSVVDEVPGSHEEEGGSKGPEENREGRPAADDAGCDVTEIVGKGDDARPEICLLVAKERALDAGAETFLPDDVDVHRHDKGGREEAGQEGSGGYGQSSISVPLG